MNFSLYSEIGATRDIHMSILVPNGPGIRSGHQIILIGTETEYF